ncbi:MAG: V-type ATP synthase subunit I [Bacteroidota bacterium]
MIIPMRKYSFLIFHRDYEPFLQKLKDLGVVHIIEQNKDAGKELLEKYKQVQLFDKNIKFLKKRNVEESNPSTDKSGEEIIEEIENISKEQEKQKQKLALLKKELSFSEPWGEYSKETIEKLQQQNVNLYFFSVGERNFKEEWKDQYNLTIINTIQKVIYFVIISRDDNKPEIEAEEIELPERPSSVIHEEIQNVNQKINQLESRFDELAKKYISQLEKAKDKIAQEADYLNVKENTNIQAEGKLMVLEGWVPRTKEQNLLDYLDKEEVYYMSAEPRKDEKAPVLLSNNRFNKLFEPIGKLFSLPAYNEMDLTPYFAPFFMMFFGFCLGDAGYGLVIILGAGLYKLKAPASWKPVLSLAQVLGLGTFIFGVLSGTLFGIDLIDSEIPFLSKLKTIFLDRNQLFYLSMILGLIQISIGLIIRAINKARQNGVLHAVNPLGWFLLIYGMLDNFVLNITGPFAQYVIYLSLGMIIFFSAPGKNILKQFGIGLWDLYGITGLFGDVLSYIRLFAIGISSAILGFVVNDIAMQVKTSIPVVGPVLFIIILLLGHTGNLLISSLGSFVHPMRLTFVEFYKNAGFSGGGKEFKPFSNKTKID